MKEEKKHKGFGEVHTVKEWAKLLQVSQRSINNGLRAGMDIERIAEVLEVEPKKTKRTPAEDMLDAARQRRLNKKPTSGTQYAGFGTLATCPEWAERLGIPRNSMWRYLKKGMTVEEVAEMRGVEYSAKYGRLK